MTKRQRLIEQLQPEPGERPTMLWWILVKLEGRARSRDPQPAPTSPPRSTLSTPPPNRLHPDRRLDCELGSRERWGDDLQAAGDYILQGATENVNTVIARGREGFFDA